MCLHSVLFYHCSYGVYFVFKQTSFGSVRNSGGGGAVTLDRPPDYYGGEEEVRSFSLRISMLPDFWRSMDDK